MTWCHGIEVLHSTGAWWSQMASDAVAFVVFLVVTERAVKQTIELLVSWDAMALRWSYCSEEGELYRAEMEPHCSDVFIGTRDAVFFYQMWRLNGAALICFISSYTLVRFSNGTIHNNNAWIRSREVFLHACSKAIGICRLIQYVNLHFREWCYVLICGNVSFVRLVSAGV